MVFFIHVFGTTNWIKYLFEIVIFMCMFYTLTPDICLQRLSKCCLKILVHGGLVSPSLLHEFFYFCFFFSDSSLFVLCFRYLGLFTYSFIFFPLLCIVSYFDSNALLQSVLSFLVIYFSSLDVAFSHIVLKICLQC